MSAINKAMEALDDDEARRVLDWATDKFGGTERPRQQQAGAGSAPPRLEAKHTSEGGFERISDLMDAAKPTTIVDYVLVASYWYQVIQGNESFTGQQVNADLKDLGHGSKNITDSYNSLIKRKPPLVRQIEKAGKAKQARKKYRLTNEGVRAVETLLAGEADE